MNQDDQLGDDINWEEEALKKEEEKPIEETEEKPIEEIEEKPKKRKAKEVQLVRQEESGSIA